MSIYTDIDTSWGVNPPAIYATIPGAVGMTPTTVSIEFEHYCQSPNGETFWDFETEDPENTTLSGLQYISKRGVRLVATMDFPMLSRVERTKLQQLYNEANHLVNRGAEIEMKLHRDDDESFKVRFVRPPRPTAYGVRNGLKIQLIGTELLEEEPVNLKSLGTPV